MNLNEIKFVELNYGESSTEGGLEGLIGRNGTQCRKDMIVEHSQLFKEVYPRLGITNEEFNNWLNEDKSNKYRILEYAIAIKGILHVGFFEEKKMPMLCIPQNVTVKQLSSLYEWWNDFSVISDIKELYVSWYFYNFKSKEVLELPPGLDSEKRLISKIDTMLYGQLKERERANLLKMRELVQKCIEREGEDR